MENKKHWSQAVPIFLIWCYVILFFCTNLQVYADIYDDAVTFLDTFLFVYSFLYYLTDGVRWGFVAKRSFIAVISLNILNEINYPRVMTNYYMIYCLIIVVYIISLMIDARIKKHKNHKENYSS